MALDFNSRAFFSTLRRLAPTLRCAYALAMAQQDCPHCRGTGWRLVDRVEAGQVAERVVDTTDDRGGRRQDVPRGASTAVPKLRWAVPCDCTGDDRTARTMVRARVPRRYEHCNFDNFDTGLWDPATEGPNAQIWNRSLARAKLIVEAFAKEHATAGSAGLLLTGTPGVGKTHLAIAALKQIMSRGLAVRFYDYRDLLKQVQASYDPNNPSSETGVLAPVLSTEVLLLDDLGASKASDWALETIAYILNTRYNEERVTILTTGLPDVPRTSSDPIRLPGGDSIRVPAEPTLADRVGPQVRSRLYEMCRQVEIESPDYRRLRVRT